MSSPLSQFIPGAKNSTRGRSRQEVIANLFPQTVLAPVRQVNEDNLFTGRDQVLFEPVPQPAPLPAVPMEGSVSSAQLFHAGAPQPGEDEGIQLTKLPWNQEAREGEDTPIVIHKTAKHTYTPAELQELGLTE